MNEDWHFRSRNTIGQLSRPKTRDCLVPLPATPIFIRRVTEAV